MSKELVRNIRKIINLMNRVESRSTHILAKKAVIYSSKEQETHQQRVQAIYNAEMGEKRRGAGGRKKLKGRKKKNRVVPKSNK